MAVIELESLADPRLEPYRDLKDRELAVMGDLFIAEGEHVVRRLIDSPYSLHSVLLARRRVAEIAPLVPADVDVYSVPDVHVEQILGYKFHSGVMACGRRGPGPTIAQLMQQLGDRALTLVICPEVINADNMGSLIRISTAFGADAMILGQRSCDPFWRRSIRVSMGNIFRLPLIRSDDLRRDLIELRERWNVELIATVLDPTAQPLEHAGRRSRVGILFGSESQGLEPYWLRVCDRQVTIPMQRGTDSLNVSVAAGIFLYHFTRYAPVTD